MGRLSSSLGLVVLLAALVASCPGTPAIPGGIDGRGGGVSPDACGKLDTSKVGRKLYAFLNASAELDRASVELEASVAAACKRMARALGVSDAGNTREVCTRASTELQNNLQVSVKSESKLVTRYQPPECHTEVDFAAAVVAACEATAAANVDVRCSGTCGGTCNGTCRGTCEGGGGGGTCDGTCKGTCEGRCTGRCDGYADVNASAECKASAEVRASVKTECSEPKVEVVRENITVVDDAKFQKALAAIDVGLPAILRAAKKLEYAGKAAGAWGKTAVQLAAASGDLVKELGEKGLCVGGQLAAVAAASTNIQARFSVSIEMSASVSSSCGATAQ